MPALVLRRQHAVSFSGLRPRVGESVVGTSGVDGGLRMDKPAVRRPVVEDSAEREFQPKRPLGEHEIDGIVLTVKSAFVRLADLYGRILPLFTQYGFRPPSAGVMARDLSEQIERSIIQHTRTFFSGDASADLARFGECWEARICKGAGRVVGRCQHARTGRDSPPATLGTVPGRSLG